MLSLCNYNIIKRKTVVLRNDRPKRADLIHVGRTRERTQGAIHRACPLKVDCVCLYLFCQAAVLLVGGHIGDLKMPRANRRDVLSDGEVQVVHCVNRCVRRARQNSPTRHPSLATTGHVARLLGGLCETAPQVQPNKHKPQQAINKRSLNNKVTHIAKPAVTEISQPS